jgi:copper resistance protein B
MKHNPSAAFVTAFTLAVSLFQPGAASAQDDMKDMPGMAKPEPKKPATAPSMEDMPGMAPAAPKKGTPNDKAAPADQKKMDAMPGMKNGAAPAQSEMDGMPGMDPAKPTATGKKDSMDGMPGMAGDAAVGKDKMAGMPGMKGDASAGKGNMAGMPGMEGGASAAQPMSEPGIRVLGPHQKWVPPAGDNRADELLSQPMLQAHMKGLPEPVEDSMINSFLLFDLFEYRAYNSGLETMTWDFVGWIGGDYNRLWIKSEGDWDLNHGNAVEGDVQLLYGRLIAPFWDFQAGVRQAFIGGSNQADHSRTYAVIGFQGLAPGEFDLEPALYISDRGDVSGDFTASIDFYLTQKLVLQPRLEGQFSFQDDKQFGTASGVTQTDLGLRLRYEITREFAPYIGVSWLQKYGGTADIARSEGDSSGTVAFVAGVRFWF